MVPTQHPMGARTPDLRIIAAYAAIYFVWGSTFLAIRYALESFPPLLLIALRSTIAGAVLLGWVLLNQHPQLTWRHWRTAAIGGVCFFVLGHGGLSWAQQVVPSGLAALVMALIPIWIVVLNWLRPGGSRPGRATTLGVVLGFAGLAVLIGSDASGNGGTLDLVAIVVLVVSALAWAAGSVASSSIQSNLPPAALAAMQLLCGGGILLVPASLGGEWQQLFATTITPRAWLAMGFLVVFGSVLTFSAYIWLLRVSSPARVATYAYVNPVVAVLLGWSLGGESLTTQSLIAGACIVVAVALIVGDRKPQIA